MLRGITAARSVALTMAGKHHEVLGDQPQPVFQLQLLHDAQGVGMRAHRHELQLAAAPPAGPCRCGACA